MVKSLRFDVFGREIVVLRVEARWQALDVGGDGTRRAATDIRLPSDLPAEEIATYLDDLCHESATPRHPRVTRID